MEIAIILLVIAVVLTLVFDYINGFHDAANAIATVVSTRALSPVVAVLFGAALNLVGALLGTEVAATIGKVWSMASLTIHTVLCTVSAAIIWNLITWYKGLPTSSSHAIIGSFSARRFSRMNMAGIFRAKRLSESGYADARSPILGITIGFLVMWALTWMVYKAPIAKNQQDVL